jgi:hypothetical protein
MVNLLLDKEAFIDNSYVSFVGEYDIGRAIASRENKVFLKTICDKLTIKRKCNLDRLAENMRLSVKELTELQLEPAVIIFNDWKAAITLLHSGEIKKGGKSAEDSSDFFGFFGEFPVFLIRECPVSCCVLDMSNLGVLNQCKLETSDPYVKTNISIVDEKVAKETVEKNSNYLKDENGKEISLDKAIARLRTKVHLTCVSKKEFEVKNQKAGAIIELEA